MISVGGLVLVAILAMVELALLFLCFGPRARGGPLSRVGRWAVLHALCVALVVAGGYLETRWHTYRLSRAWIAASLRGNAVRPVEPFSLRGDPGLQRAVLDPQLEREPPRDADPEVWREWQQTLRARLQGLFELREVTEPRSVRYTAEPSAALGAGVERRFIILEAADGTALPAYLFEPTPAPQPGPAVLVLHGHVNPFEEGIAQTAGLTASYHGGAALELARAGFRTLTLELRGFGKLGAQAGLEHALVAHNALLQGSFYKAVLARDVKQAVELLRSLPEVDPARVGITGISFGAELALDYAALDPSIAAVALHGHGGDVGPVRGMEGNGPIHWCHLVPGHNRLLHLEDWYRLVAPRPLLVLRGSREGVALDALEARVRPIYTALGTPENFAARIEPGGHQFFAAPAVDFFRRHL